MTCAQTWIGHDPVMRGFTLRIHRRARTDVHFRRREDAGLKSPHRPGPEEGGKNAALKGDSTIFLCSSCVYGWKERAHQPTGDGRIPSPSAHLAEQHSVRSVEPGRPQACPPNRRCLQHRIHGRTGWPPRPTRTAPAGSCPAGCTRRGMSPGPHRRRPWAGEVQTGVPRGAGFPRRSGGGGFEEPWEERTRTAGPWASKRHAVVPGSFDG